MTKVSVWYLGFFDYLGLLSLMFYMWTMVFEMQSLLTLEFYFKKIDIPISWL